jgi:hypothetical protein
MREHGLQRLRMLAAIALAATKRRRV